MIKSCQDDGCVMNVVNELIIFVVYLCLILVTVDFGICITLVSRLVARCSNMCLVRVSCTRTLVQIFVSELTDTRTKVVELVNCLLITFSS